MKQPNANLEVILVLCTVSTDSSKDFTNEDCLVCAILSHGDSNGFISTYDGKIHLQTFFDAFSDKACPSLKGKPKIFVVQVISFFFNIETVF